ncbi:hypothetical protein FB451DRAFT_1412638 [Mycena latifolia]|nr:hypothetical protein FB451DRAFT_1412638 [Mycena latifolia]
MERPYVVADLNGNKDSLIKLVQRQQSKWPHAKFHKSKVTVAALKSALLDPTYGFTTNQPLVSSPGPPRSTSHSALPQQTTLEAPPAETSTSPAQDLADTELLDVRIYLEDCRFDPTQKTVAVVPLPVLDREDVPIGGFRVLGKDIIGRLQRSNIAIEFPRTGIIRISVPDPLEPGWKMPFVRVVHAQSVEAMEFDPEALEISVDRRLRLFVENVAISSAPAIEMDAPPMNTAASASGSAPMTEKKDLKQGPADDPVVQYLLQKLATRAGYASFVANRSHVLSNPEVVKDWYFAVQSSRDYTKTRTPEQAKISKAHIQSALGIGSTWLANASTAISIIETYGPDKPSSANEVIEQLELVEDPAEGAAVLLRFLTEWKKEHPI